MNTLKQLYVLSILLLLIGSGCYASSAVIVDLPNEHCTDVSSWTGTLRIEGKNNTIWAGEVTVTNKTITVENASSGKMEPFYFEEPCVLTALDEASQQGEFSYHAVYYPEWDAFFVQSIESDSDWWHYWVNYTLPMVGAGKFLLDETHSEILFGYLEDWNAQALRINVSTEKLMINEPVTITVTNATLAPVENATVIIGITAYKTDETGTVVVEIEEFGVYNVTAEKTSYVRSEKRQLIVHGPQLDLELGPGGLGLTVQLSNIGDRKATHVNWSFVFSGGLTLLPIGGEKKGAIEELDISTTEILRSLLLAFGKHRITIQATCAEGSDVSIEFEAIILGLIFFISST